MVAARRRRASRVMTAGGRRGQGPVKGVVFDFDGVIVESAEIKTEAFLDLFAGYPQHLEAIRRHHLQNLGISRYRKFEWICDRLLGRRLTPAESQRLGDEFSALVFAKTVSCPMVTGAPELLEGLKDKLLCFLVSGTPAEELLDIVRSRGLASYFARVRGTPSTKEEILREILADFRLSPGEIAMVGDGVSDLQAAKIVGVPFIARINPAHPGQFDAMDVAKIDDLRQLPAALRDLHGSGTD